MAQTALELAQGLSEENWQLYGPRQEEIFEVCHPSSPPKQQRGVLYLVAKGDFSDLSPDSACCILSVPQNRLPSVLEALQRTLAQDYRRSTLLARIGYSISQVTEDEGIASLCYDLFNGPVYLLNRQFQVVDFHDPQHLKEHFPKAFFFENMPLSTGLSTMMPDGNCPYPRLLGTIRHQGEVTGFLLVFDTKEGTPLTQTLQKDLEKVCTLLSVLPKVESRHNHSQAQQFIRALLQGQVQDPLRIRQRFLELGYPEFEKYYVFSVHVEHPDGNAIWELQRHLSSLLNMPVHWYNHYFVALLGCDSHISLSQYMFPQLTKFLEDRALWWCSCGNNFIKPFPLLDMRIPF